VRRLGLVLVLVAGCSERVELLPTLDLGGAGDGGVTLPTATGPACAAGVAAGLHRYAACTCTPFSSTRMLQTLVFDSTGAATSHSGAAWGTSGNFIADKPVALEGALVAAGIVQLGDGLTTTETVHAAAGLSSTNATHVSGDAFSGGDVSGAVTVAGTLHVPSSAAVGSSVSAGAIVREPVTVADPCDCAGAAAVDVAGAIAAAAAHNDDGAAGLDPGTLAASASLPAGTFYVAAIATDADVTLAVHGKAALAVAGDVTWKGAFTVALDAGAELDLFVGGALATQSNRTFGSTAAPARVRVWTNSAATLVLDGTPTVGALVTAPNATVDAPGGVTLYGSLLAQSFTTENDAIIHWDQAILALPAACGAAPLSPVR